VATGWPVLVSLPDDELAQGLATAAVAAWLGARVFRVPWMRETRRVLRMVSAIRGDIPPAYAVRGLALAREAHHLQGRLLLTMSITAIARPGRPGPAAQSCLTGGLPG